MNVELLADAKATLGESPIWDARTQTVYWVDILDKRIFAGSDLLVQMDEWIGCIAPRKSDGLVLAQRFSFASLDRDSGKATSLSTLKDEPSNNRFNDGKCDPWGRFIAGTMDIGEKDPLGSLY